MTAIIRLVCHDDPLSAAILLEIGGIVAHAETIMPGGTIIGAFAEGGVQERPLDYDGGKFKYEVLVGLSMTSEMETSFHHYLRACIGEAYDFCGLAKFVEHFDLHRKHMVFCSALVQDALRGCVYFPRPLPIPAHETSPRILHQMLLCRPDIQFVTRDDPIFKAHVSAQSAEKTGN